MKCDKTDPLLYLSARVGVLSAALPSWEELMRRPEREEAAPERQDALPLREDAQTGALLDSLARGAGRPIVDSTRCNGCGICEYRCPSNTYRSFAGGTQRGINVERSA